MPDQELNPRNRFGEELRAARIAKGWTQAGLGTKIGADKAKVSRVENGKASVTRELAVTCDRVLNMGGRLVASFDSDRSVLDTARFDIPPILGRYAGRPAQNDPVIAAISERGGQCAPVVLLHGPPDSGKTTLAKHVAYRVRHRYPDGCFFVDFARRAQGRSVHADLLKRLGVPDAEIPATPDEAQSHYLRELYHRAVLIVADGVTSDDQVATLVSASPACAVIATSRSRLEALDCERVPVPPLPGDGQASIRRTAAVKVLPEPLRLGEPLSQEAVRRLLTDFVRTAMAADGALMPARYRPPETSTAAVAAAVSFAEPAHAMGWCRERASLIPQLCALALRSGCYEECWRLAYAMRDYFFAARAFEPWVSSHRIALRATRSTTGERAQWAEAATRNNLGMAYVEQGRLASAMKQYDQALTLLRALGDDRGVATTLGHQAWASHAAGRDERAVALAGRATALSLRHDDQRAVAIMARTAALACAKLGRHDEALRLLDECRDILSGFAPGLPIDEAMLHNCLGEVRLAKGQPGQAATFHQRVVEAGPDVVGAGELARARRGLAAAARAAG